MGAASFLPTQSCKEADANGVARRIARACAERQSVVCASVTGLTWWLTTYKLFALKQRRIQLRKILAQRPVARPF